MRRLSWLVVLALLGGPSSARAADRVIVLDAGHGGKKTGTKTPAGVSEASIVLQIARYTREALERQGVRVVMTRDDDRDLDLGARIAIANGTPGVAAFVSVHGNWAPVPERHGSEIYILSPAASDDTAAELVEVENEGGAAEPKGPPPVGGDLDFILQDLQRMTAHKDSALLAKAVEDGIGKVAALAPSRGLRQAPFKVLRGAKMPAALVEVGYLSHPGHGALLATAAGQKQAGDAIARGIVRFLKALDERL